LREINEPTALPQQLIVCDFADAMPAGRPPERRTS
jgi:hypothetical protein